MDPDGRVRDVLDEAEILGRVGGDRVLFREIAGIFLTESPKTLAEIRESLALHEGERLFVAAHRLKGSVSNFSAPAALCAAVKVEQLAREGNLEGVEHACIDLERELGRVRQALLALIARD